MIRYVFTVISVVGCLVGDTTNGISSSMEIVEMGLLDKMENTLYPYSKEERR